MPEKPLPGEGYYSMRHLINGAMRDRLQRLYWFFMSGATVTVKWPVVSQFKTQYGPFTFTGDPNDMYRPWLETNVGRQGLDWQWQIRFGILNNQATDQVQIQLRRGKTKLAPMIALMWS